MPKRKPEITSKQAQAEHQHLQAMGQSRYAQPETVAASREHQGAQSFRDCPACTRRLRRYRVVD